MSVKEGSLKKLEVKFAKRLEEQTRALEKEMRAEMTFLEDKLRAEITLVEEAIRSEMENIYIYIACTVFLQIAQGTRDSSWL